MSKVNLFSYRWSIEFNEHIPFITNNHVLEVCRCYRDPTIFVFWKLLSSNFGGRTTPQIPGSSCENHRSWSLSTEVKRLMFSQRPLCDRCGNQQRLFALGFVGRDPENSRGGCVNCYWSQTIACEIVQILKQRGLTPK